MHGIKKRYEVKKQRVKRSGEAKDMLHIIYCTLLLQLRILLKNCKSVLNAISTVMFVNILQYESVLYWNQKRNVF